MTDKKPYEFYNNKGVVYVKWKHKDKEYDMPAEKAGEALMTMGLFILAALFVGALLCQEVKEGGSLA